MSCGVHTDTQGASATHTFLRTKDLGFRAALDEEAERSHELAAATTDGRSAEPEAIALEAAAAARAEAAAARARERGEGGAVRRAQNALVAISSITSSDTLERDA